MNDTIAELTALEAKATPEPWEEQDDDEVGAEGKHVATFYCFNSRFDAWCVTKEEQKANAALIVKMRNALPEVLRGIKSQIEFSQLALAREEDARVNARVAGEERDAAITRAEKAEADLLVEKRVLAAFQVMLESAKAERDVLAEKLGRYGLFPCDDNSCVLTDQDGSDPDKCGNDPNGNCWLTWAAQEAAKRGEEV